MKPMKFVALLVTGLALGMSGSAWQQDYYGGFDGTWEGKMKFLGSYPDPRSQAAEFSERRLIIKGENVHVYTKPDANWVDSKPGAYRIFTSKTNAVIFAIDSGAAWVETWNYTITHKGRDDLFVYAVRSVNNFEETADFKNAEGIIIGRFFQARFGEMVRVRAADK
jgi:hypothetical protein